MIVLTLIWQDKIEQFMGINMDSIKGKIRKEMEAIQGEEPAPNVQVVEHVAARVERLNRFQSYLDLLDLYGQPGRTDIPPGYVARHADPVITKIMKDRLLNYWPYTIINCEE